MTQLLVATVDGVHELGGDRPRVTLAGQDVNGLTVDGETAWGLVGGKELVCRQTVGGDFREVATSDRWAATSLLAARAGVLVGTAEAHLLRLVDGRLEPVAGFEEAAGRDAWYTPWGGPPDVRSMSEADDGVVLVNVHVGGIVRSADGGRSWHPTIDIDADVHQVVAVAGRPSLALAAAAVGLASSRDGGLTWDVEDDGLHASYCRAVAVAGDHVLLSASTGPGGSRSALYRRPLGSHGPFERCRAGLPDWFTGNLDTHCLAARGAVAAFATKTGDVYVSGDEGGSWQPVAAGLPAPRALVVP
jgi:hypothetical protein